MKRLQGLVTDLLWLAGLGFICWGIFKLSIAAGLVASGAALICVAISLAPEKKKS